MQEHPCWLLRNEESRLRQRSHPPPVCRSTGMCAISSLSVFTFGASRASGVSWKRVSFDFVSSSWSAGLQSQPSVGRRHNCSDGRVWSVSNLLLLFCWTSDLEEENTEDSQGLIPRQKILQAAAVHNLETRETTRNSSEAPRFSPLFSQCPEKAKGSGGIAIFDAKRKFKAHAIPPNINIQCARAREGPCVDRQCAARSLFSLEGSLLCA